MELAHQISAEKMSFSMSRIAALKLSTTNGNKLFTKAGQNEFDNGNITCFFQQVCVCLF
jgi:hypothetical protein